MPINIIIKTTHIDLSDEIKDYVEKKFNKLPRYFDNILEIRVELERMQEGHHNKGKIYRAEANIHVPKKILRVSKEADNLYKAIDKAEDHMREIITEFKRKLNNQ